MEMFKICEVGDTIIGDVEGPETGGVVQTLNYSEIVVGEVEFFEGGKSCESCWRDLSESIGWHG